MATIIPNYVTTGQTYSTGQTYTINTVNGPNYTPNHPNYYAPTQPGVFTSTSTFPMIYTPSIDPGPSNEEVDIAIRSIKRTIEKLQDES